MVKCFATISSGDRMNVFLLNRDTLKREIQLEILNEPTIEPKGAKWIFTGTSLKDQYPTWTELKAVRLKEGKVRDILNPFSITMYSFMFAD